jgi:hypothetical protein
LLLFLKLFFDVSTFCLDAKSGAKKSRTNEWLRPFVHPRTTTILSLLDNIIVA